MEGSEGVKHNTTPRRAATTPRLPISGKLQDFEFHIEKEKELKCVRYCNMVATYYEGRLTHQDEHEEEVCFLCVSTSKKAHELVICSNRVIHTRVMQAKWYFYNTELKKHLVIFDRFEDGLQHAQSPKALNPILGNPNQTIQHNIRELTDALIEMHKVHVSSSWLRSSNGYVWCKKTETLNIIRADILMDAKDKIMRSIDQFSYGLHNAFLNTEDPWPERDNFLKCFTISGVELDNRLDMIYNHPFLENESMKILLFFSEIYQAQQVKYVKKYRGKDLTCFLSALKDANIKSRFVDENGEWTKPWNGEFKWDEEFKSIFNKVSYNKNDMRDHLRFMRNIFQHVQENEGMTWDDVIHGVATYWPGLIECYYEKLYGAD